MRTLIRLVRTLILLLVLALLAGAWWWLQDEALRPRAGRPQRGLEPEGCGPAPALPALRAAGRVRAPLLVVLHGSRGDGAQMRRISGYGFDRLAAQEGFLVAYPDGFEGHWNDCRKAASYSARLRDVDDVAFLRALVARLARSTASIRSGYMSPATQWRPDGFPPGRRSTGVAGGDRNGGGEPADHGERCLSAGRAADRCVLINGTRDPINPYLGGRSACSASATGARYARPWTRHAGGPA